MKMQKLMGALILILMLGATPVTAQNMSDSQVLEYVKEGIRPVSYTHLTLPTN